MNAPSTSTSLANPFDVWFQPIPVLKGKSMMDHLFFRLDGLYPHKWRSAFPDEQAIDNWKCAWAEAFEEEHIAPADIKAGLKACRTKNDWPPSCAEFMKACKPPIDPMVAYYEALTGLQARAKGASGLWSHPAVYWAAAGLSFDLLNQTFSSIKVRWEKALADQLDKGTWEAIPAPMIALDAPDKSWTKQAATETLKAIGASELLQPKTDHHRWWKKILQREADGDKTVTTYQLREARLAQAGTA